MSMKERYFQLHDDSDGCAPTASSLDNLEAPASFHSETEESTRRRNRLFSLGTRFLLAAGVVGSILYVAQNSESLQSSWRSTFNAKSSQFTTTEATSDYSISVSIVSTDYGEEINALSLLPWDTIVEPSRTQTASISSFVVDGDSRDASDVGYVVSWSICDGKVTGVGNSLEFEIEGSTGSCESSVTIAEIIPAKQGRRSRRRRTLSSAGGVPETDDHANAVDALLDATDEEVTEELLSDASISAIEYTYSFLTAVKYVRREIRDMTDDDRDKFFTALKLLYTEDLVPGKAKYGEKFKTAEYFSYKHLNGAGTVDCDHWHDGAGILTHHMAFTLEVEQSLQAIDPSISMPYWEYGMDTYLYDHWWNSPFFGSDWFGEEPTNDDHAIKDGGLWDGVEVPDGDSYHDWSIAETGSLNPFVNAYDQMRAPWNNNPVQAIGRHNQTYGKTQYSSMPTCSTLQSCFKQDSLAGLNDCLNGATHGPVHILIGGAWGEGDLFDDEDVTMVQNPDKILFFKVLWRMGWTRCPDSCEVGESCRCSVPDEYIDTYGAYYILESTNVVYGLTKYLSGYDQDDPIFLKVLRAVEDPGIAGEMFSSAAGFDPSFWPLHGAMERMAGLKRIFVSMGEIEDFDDTWAFVDYNKYSGAAYLDGVCDWSKVAGSGDLTLPTCTLDVTCFGHNENDLIEFSGFTSDDDAYTNIDFFNFMHPWTDELPYTYDTYDYDYCEEQGSYFNAEDDVLVNDSSEGLLPLGDVTTTIGTSDVLGLGKNQEIGPMAASSSSSSEKQGVKVLRKSRDSSKLAYRKALKQDGVDGASTRRRSRRLTDKKSSSLDANVLTYKTSYSGFAKGQKLPTWTKKSTKNLASPSSSSSSTAEGARSAASPRSASNFPGPRMVPTMRELEQYSKQLNQV